MTLGPVLPGRIPTSLIATRLQHNIQESTNLLTLLQDQIATGQKFFLPGEAPSAAARTIYLQKIVERKTQMQTNVATNTSMLAASENALTGVSDALNHARGLAHAGIGETATDTEREALAAEVHSLIQSVLQAANTQFRGRYIFGGSEGTQIPFSTSPQGAIRYNGDSLAINAFADLDLLLANNVDGRTAFGAGTQPVTRDTNPALTLTTRLADLHGGDGVPAGPIVVTLDNGGTPQTQTIDLAGAETIQDVKARIENAFAAGPLTVTVEVDPATNHGIRLTPSAGTVSVTDVTGSTTAAQLGIASAPAAAINGGDLNPALTLQTALSSLNGGTGIGPTAGNGLHIVNGTRTSIVDISSANTVEDLFNLLRQADPDLDVAINEAGNGLAITTRLSGVDFSIGENNGQNATLLGIRTLTADTLLADLNGGAGVPTGGPEQLEIIRRDGSTAQIDLSTARTIQDVLDAINAVDPGILMAGLNTVGNGITVLDNDGVSTGPLTINENGVSAALGLAGSEPGADPTVPLVGSDPNPQQSQGVFGLLSALETALLDNDDQEISRIAEALDLEVERFNMVRSDLGARMKLMENVENRLLDEQVQLAESLSVEFDADIAESITRLAQLQATYAATLKVAAQTSQLSLLSFL